MAHTGNTEVDSSFAPAPGSWRDEPTEVIGLSHWYLLPVGLSLATVAMSAGISGSSFWLPLFLLVLSLPPRMAFWLALATMIFGAGSGVLANWRAGTIDGALAGRLLVVAAPAAAIGGILSGMLPARPLLLLFAAIAATNGLRALVVPDTAASGEHGSTRMLGLSALAGGSLQGLVATGCGAVVLPSLLRTRAQPPATLVGTTVLVVFACAVVATLARLDGLMIAALEQHATEVGSMLLFAAPGVFLGGQLGPLVARRLPRATLRRYFGVVLLAVAVVVALRAFEA